MQFVEFDRTPNNMTGSPNMTRIYAASNSKRTEYRFHINAFDEFMGIYKIYDTKLERITVEEIPLYEPAPAVFRLSETFVPREDQLPYIDFVLSPGTNKLVELQTGMGKTAVALFATAKMGVRTAIVLKGGYIERWLPDLKSILGLKDDEIRVIRGLGAMAELCQDAALGKLYESVIVFSTDTLRMYEDHYEIMEDMSLFSNIVPQLLWYELGVGFRIIDEVHQLFHANFKQDLYTHIPKTLSLSATMVPGTDQLKQYLYRTMFPKSARIPNAAYKKYVKVYTLLYELGYKGASQLRWNRRGSNDYSQTEFEKSILKAKKVREAYIDMITDYVMRAYVERRTANEKLLIFCGTVDFCSVLTKHLKQKLPKFVINKYTSEDPYANIASADIIVSTVGSLGTAHDIPDLWQVHLTVGLGKEDTNLQVIGRLRIMKNFPGRAPEMYYYACTGIDKHMRYHKTKKELFSTRVVTHTEHHTGVSLT